MISVGLNENKYCSMDRKLFYHKIFQEVDLNICIAMPYGSMRKQLILLAAVETLVNFQLQLFATS